MLAAQGYAVIGANPRGSSGYGRDFSYALWADWGNKDYQESWPRSTRPFAWASPTRTVSPFFQVEKVTTPTLILCGQEDWNVPLLNSEQLYQALRRLGRETELVIYPGQSHGITKPSYQKDRLERYIGWYDRYLKGKVGEGERAP